MAEIKIAVRGKAAEAIDTIRRITGKHEPVDVIVAALRVYEWILAQQVAGAAIVAEYPKESQAEDQELVNYVEDPDTALSFFGGRDIFVHH